MGSQALKVKIRRTSQHLHLKHEKHWIQTHSESGEGWVTPFPENTQTYQTISDHLRTGITELIPDNLAEQARLALGFE